MTGPSEVTTGYKLTLLLRRRDGLTPDGFADAWLARDRHPPTAPGLVRYAVVRALDRTSPIAGASRAPYDAAVETWWTHQDHAENWVGSPGFSHEWLPSRRALLADPPRALAGNPVLVWEREAWDDQAAQITLITLPVARAGLSSEEFVAHWAGAHAQLALGGPGTKDRLLRLENTPATEKPPSPFTPAPYDGAGAITFASAEAVAEEFGSAHYREFLAPDEPRFTDTARSDVFIGTRVDVT